MDETSKRNEAKANGESMNSAMLASVQHRASRDLAKDYSELLLDSGLAEGIIKEIPIVKTVFALSGTVSTVRDRLFLGKVLRFLGFLQEQLDEEERTKMVRKLQEDPAFGARAGQKLIEILERMESQRKPAMLAAMLVAFGRGEIDARTVMRLTCAIERLPAFAVPEVRRFVSTPMENQDVQDPIGQWLLAAGLANSPSSFWDKVSIAPNPVCNEFLRLNLDQLPE